MTKSRPQWEMNGKNYPATFPACGVDLNASMKRALSHRIPYERMNEVTDFIKSAIAFHLQSAQAAYIHLAVKARNSDINGYLGWEVEVLDCIIPGATELLLTNKDEPGGYHLSIRAHKVLNDEAKSRKDGLQDAISKELDEIDVPIEKRFIRSVLSAKNPTPSEKLAMDIDRDPQNYRAVEAGDDLHKILVTAVNIKGPPSGIEASDSNALSTILNCDVDEDYLRGQHIAAGVSGSTGPNNFLSEGHTSLGGSADIVMPIISGLLASNGLSPKVNAGAKKISKIPFCVYGSEYTADTMDAAHASVLEASGLFNFPVQRRVEEFSNGIACHDITNNLEDYKTLAKNLLSEQYIFPEKAFEANDMLDYGYSSPNGNGVSLFSETQHSTYRLDMTQDEQGDVTMLEARDIKAPGRPVIGRFVFVDGVWCEDYIGDLSEREPACTDIKSKRGLNNMIASLASLSCVLEDELRERQDRDTPEL